MHKKLKYTKSDQGQNVSAGQEVHKLGHRKLVEGIRQGRGMTLREKG